MNIQDFSKAKPGDKVYSLLHEDFVEIHSVIEDEVRYTHKMYAGHFFADGSRNRGGIQLFFWDVPRVIAPPRPKKMVMKTVEAWANIYPDGIKAHKTEEMAKKFALPRSVIAIAVKFTVTYGVEEDEA